MMEIPIPDVVCDGSVYHPTEKTDALASRVYQVYFNLDMLAKSPGFVDYCQTVRDLEADVTKISDVLPDILAELMVMDIIDTRALTLREKVEIAWNTWVKDHVLDTQYFTEVSK